MRGPLWLRLRLFPIFAAITKHATCSALETSSMISFRAFFVAAGAALKLTSINNDRASAQSSTATEKLNA
jgi:hypothetical protein